jgi:hypothetical protein
MDIKKHRRRKEILIRMQPNCFRIFRPDRCSGKEQSLVRDSAAAVHGATANFGTWTIVEAKKTLTVRYVGSVFPNQAGTESTPGRAYRVLT